MENITVALSANGTSLNEVMDAAQAKLDKLTETAKELNTLLRQIAPPAKPDNFPAHLLAFDFSHSK
jgi:hypothetical protein